MEWYFSVPIRQDHWQFPLQSQYTKTISSYQFTCLSFCLSTVPRVFRKLLKPYLVCSVIYINNIVLMAWSEEEALDNTGMTLNLLESLGFLVSYPKSQLVPTCFKVGFKVDSNTLSLSLLALKVVQIRQEVQRVQRLEWVSATRQLAQLIRKLSAAIQAVQPAPPYYRTLQRLKHQATARGYNS